MDMYRHTHREYRFDGSQGNRVERYWLVASTDEEAVEKLRAVYPNASETLRVVVSDAKCCKAGAK